MMWRLVDARVDRKKAVASVRSASGPFGRAQCAVAAAAAVGAGDRGINVYAHGKDVFDEHAAELGELFAKPAAVAVHNAQILAHALALTAQLQTALSTRSVIDQAIGLIRGRSGRSAEEAFTQLWVISQTEHRKVAAVAQRIVDEAVRRGRRDST